MVAWYLPIKSVDIEPPFLPGDWVGPGVPWPAFEAYHLDRGGQGWCAVSVAVGVVLVALDVLIDGLPDHVGEVTILSPCDLFELASAVRVEAQAVGLGCRHGLHPWFGRRCRVTVCSTPCCTALHSWPVLRGGDELGQVPG